MKYLLIISLFVLGNCASTPRPLVEPTSYPTPDFNGIVDSYITMDLKAQAPDPNIILVNMNDPRFTGPKFISPLLQQKEVKRVLSGFTCPVRGKVAVAVILDIDGTVKSPQLRRGINKLCDAKAIEAVSSAFVYPAKYDGEPIAMVLTLPITFK
ncbi:MAG: energy transducer TonB [Balneolaceae bacterium]|nr:energy transducer TonB [Balneolaceae bacterium]MBO6547916.1 energy transducer TonB [Balneolaceae bacterium]MBO6648429.1 energy transducer TonB [Balneolaceae bacterium]